MKTLTAKRTPRRLRCARPGHFTTVAQPPPRRAAAPGSALSLVGVGRVALQMVDDPGLRGAEGDPVPGGILQSEEEGFRALQRLVVQILAALELDLVGELPDQRTVIAAGAPEG